MKNVLAIGLIIALLLTILWLSNIARLQANMTSYLNTTYSREFAVGKPEIVGNEFLGFHVYSAPAYPKDQPDLKFAILWDKNEPGEYRDNYLGTKWTMQGAEAMKEKLREVYGEDFRVFDYWQAYNDKNVKELDYSEIVKQYSNKNSIDIVYYVILDDELDRQYETVRAYKILKENFIDTKTMQYSFIVAYILKDKVTEFETVRANQESWSIDFTELCKEGILQNWIRVNYTRGSSGENTEIKNSNELKSKFQY